MPCYVCESPQRILIDLLMRQGASDLLLWPLEQHSLVELRRHRDQHLPPMPSGQDTPPAQPLGE